MATDTSTLEPLPIPEPDRPAYRAKPKDWVRENLFSGPVNSIVTIVGALVIAFLAYRALRFLFVTARWEAVHVNLTNYMVGGFPRDELWRLWAAVYLLTLLGGMRWGVSVHRTRPTDGRAEASWRAPLRRFWPFIVFALVVVGLSASPVTAAALLGVGMTAFIGRVAGIRVPPRGVRWVTILFILGCVAAFEVMVAFGGVPYPDWRGLMLTLFLSIGGILLSFPLGVLLALGRRSTFPAIRALSVAYIELIRGVPLITLLFMAFLVLGFFLPPGTQTPSLVARALIAFVLFTAAYVAEVVRGGLQAVPNEQVEAAQALGLSPVKITALIVLPQALRAVIPAMVGQFISLFKDTSLAASIGLAELLRVAEQINGQPRFTGHGLQAETLGFAAFVFWVGAYWMSKTSQRLEKRLGVGER